MCQMFVATVSNSHNILHMSMPWLNHTAHCLSISISIYILNSHSGLNIAPANLLYSFRHQSNFARYYAAHCTPWGEKTTWKNCQAGYKDDNNTEQGGGMAQGSLGSRWTNGVFQTASHLVPKKEKAS